MHQEVRIVSGSAHARAGACTASGSVLAQHGAALHGSAARQEAVKKLHYCESEQILKCVSGEISRLLAQTLTVLNSDFVWSILKSVQTFGLLHQSLNLTLPDFGGVNMVRTSQGISGLHLPLVFKP